MILTNIESVPGKKIIEHYGMVSGSTVRSKHAISDLGAGLKNMFGGELKQYTINTEVEFSINFDTGNLEYTTS